MLAKTPVIDTYLPAEPLGITEAERDALIWVREELASGRIEHGNANFSDGRKTHFNMDRDGCGTAVCICGWMRVRLGRHLSIGGYTGRTVFTPLFLPKAEHLIDYKWGHLTPAQAVRAIDAWARGDQEDCWSIALASDAE